MKRTIWIKPLFFAACSFLTGVAAVTAVDAQPVKNARVTFTSVYTDTSKRCRTIGEKMAKETGSDPAFLCPGVGGYQIYISNAAMAADLGVGRKGAEQPEVSFMSECANYGRKAEWRLANGKPFAVIIRVAKYPDDNMSSLTPCSKQIGSTLLVKGLAGHGNIDFAVEATDPNANAKARQLADTAYKPK